LTDATRLEGRGEWGRGEDAVISPSSAPVTGRTLSDYDAVGEYHR